MNYFRTTLPIMTCCFLLSIITSPVLAASSDFTINQQWINPVCVWLLVHNNAAAGRSSDGTAVVLPYFKQNAKSTIIDGINLNACQASQTDGKVTSIHPNKQKQPIIQYQFPWGINKNYNNHLPRGSYSYQYIGQTNNGLDVLHSFDSGGGSGDFDSILLLKREPTKLYSASGNQTQWNTKPLSKMRLVAAISGGDRASGGFKTIDIKKNQLNVTRYNPKNLPNNPTLPDIKLRFPIPDEH